MPRNLEIHARRLDLLEVEHKQRLEYARIEHESRMAMIEAEAALLDVRCRQLAEKMAPSNDRLRAMAGTYTEPGETFDDEVMPY